jgi:hypothetical protein
VAHRGRPVLLAAGGYLALSVFLWWHVWSSHPTAVTTCGCGDPSLFTSFIEWPAYAITHGLNPFYSTAINYPTGVNLLANTSVLAIGVILAPVTWLFGPVATLNVASTLAPVLSGLAMFVLLRRWVTWSPAAFIGGLLYGFSPFMVIALSWAHLMLAMAAVPPLILICLDELLFRQHRRHPLVTGVALGLLVTVQFFIGSEILLIVAIVGAVGFILIVAHAGWRDPVALRHHARFALVGLGTAIATAVILLAYPVWFAVAGPAHFVGSVWPVHEVDTSSTLLRHYVFSAPPQLRSAHLDHLSGGYQGPILDDQYFGFGLPVVLVAGLIVWRRDRRLWLFGAIGLVSAVLSLGVSSSGLHIWLPWQLLARLPLAENIFPYRIVFVTYLAAAVMLGIIVDHTHQATGRRAGSSGHTGPGSQAGHHVPRAPTWSATAAALIVAAIALVPLAGYLARTVPITARSVDVPTWFATVAPHLRGYQVLLVFPARSGTDTDNDNPMTWQAWDKMHFALVGTGGPSGLPQRAGRERQGELAIGRISRPVGTSETPGPGDIAAVRQALDQWGATMVVIPDQHSLPPYDQIASVALAAGTIAAATGRQPIYQDGAWVWRLTGHGRRSASDQQLAVCMHNRDAPSMAAVRSVAACAVRRSGT